MKMNRYIGVKEILATPMKRGDYNIYRGWEIPEDENPNDDGYLVEYIDGGQANHPDHKGYISWSPAGVFERAYASVTGLSFGLAIAAMQKGKCVARRGWNGKNMYLQLVNKSSKGHLVVREHIQMFTAQRDLVPWVASQTDILATDWMVI